MELFKILGTVAIDGVDKATSGLSKVGNVAKAAGKAVLAGVGAAGTAMVALTKQALDASGELEQNMGGAEAVSKEHADAMVSKAGEAFSKMGLSASDYLATANKMGALFQGSGFGIDESATMASDAMQRAADVASIMGIDVSAAMEAVAGAAKGNFTMMDNLGVAINDTTLELYAQEKGLGKLKTTQDKVSAAMQMFMEKTEYAAGNYARENETLAGSMTTLKAAWDNWLSGAGDTEALADSVVGAAESIIGAVPSILPNLTNGITSLINKRAPQLPGMIQTILPTLIAAITSLIQNFATILPEIIAIILPVITETAPGILMTLTTALIDNLPMIVEAGLELILGLADGIAQAYPELIPQIVNLVISIAGMLLQNLDLIISAGISLLLALFEGILIAFIEQSQLLGDWVQANIITPISNAIAGLIAVGREVVSNIKAGISEKISEFTNVGKQVVDNIKSGISNAWSGLTSWFNNIWDNLFTKKATITVNEAGATASPRASGLDFVPYNNYPALLHEGEAVLTAGEAEQWRKGKGGGSGNGITINQYIEAVAQTPVQLASATAAYFEQARWAI